VANFAAACTDPNRDGIRRTRRTGRLPGAVMRPPLAWISETARADRLETYRPPPGGTGDIDHAAPRPRQDPPAPKPPRPGPTRHRRTGSIAVRSPGPAR